MIQDGVEVVIVKTVGGPHEGERFVPLNKLSPNGQWPPPDEFLFLDGAYRKKSQSSLPPHTANNPNLARGVVYEWVDAQS